MWFKDDNCLNTIVEIQISRCFTFGECINKILHNREVYIELITAKKVKKNDVKIEILEKI